MNSIHRSPQPQVQQQLHRMILSTFNYCGGGHFQVPALPGDQLSITLSGGGAMERRLEGRPDQGTIQPGDLTLVPRGAASTWITSDGPATVLHLFLPTDLWVSLAQGLDLDPHRIELRDDLATADPWVEQIGRTVLAEVQSDWIGGSLYLQSLEQSLALHLLRHYTSIPQITSGYTSAPIPCRRALDYIEDHLGTELSLEILAACEHLSPYHFARSFKAAVGQSPHQYVIRRRVERAQHLLKRTSRSIAQIATEVGFATPSHLHRHFKRITGCTPRHYRGSNLQVSRDPI